MYHIKVLSKEDIRQVIEIQPVIDCVDDLIAVSEKSIARAVAFMAMEEKIVAEAGSCTTVAAVQNYRERIGGKNVALIISGGNIDGRLLLELMERKNDSSGICCVNNSA